MATRVRFPSSTGPHLAGLVDEPAEPVRGWGLFVHGLTLGKDCPAAARICKQLASDGIGMLRYDNLGLADSDGDWGDGSFTQKVADTVEAIRFMAERGTPVDLLVGHSLGGAAALAAAGADRTCGRSSASARPWTPATPSTITTRSSTGCSPTATRSGWWAAEH